MADLDKVLKGLECCQNGFVCGEGCPYREVCFNGEYAFTHLAKDALELLKQYSGLTKALEQSNAVNEHLNAEIERLKSEAEKAREEGFTAGQNNVFEALNEGW